MGPMKQYAIDEEYLAFLQEIKDRQFTMLGKPANLSFDFSIFKGALSVLMNNTGDPFHASSHKLDTKRFERKVLQFFAKAYQLALEDMFGYITSGGTEGLEYGLLQGMKKCKDGVVYLSEETHYSAFTILDKLHYRYEVIPTLENGEIDYAVLKERVALQATPIVLANIGTTMKGAIDNVNTIVTLLKDKTDFYIHCDAALHGAFLPFIAQPQSVSFTQPIDSISISLHKFLGNITPAGLVMVRKTTAKTDGNAYISYIASPNNTLSCSRSGLAAFLAAYQIDSLAEEGIAHLARKCITLAQYLSGQLDALGIKNLLKDYSNIVYFKAPMLWICEKWMLPVANHSTHVVVMPHVNQEQLDALIADLSSEHMGL